MKHRFTKCFALLLLVLALVSGSALTLCADAAATPSSGLTAQQMLQTPDAPITRGQFARLVNTYLGLTADAVGAGSASTFTDVSADNPYAQDIAIAQAAGYYAGDGAGNVEPDKIVSGAEAAVAVNNIISAVLGFDMSKVNADGALAVPAWAKPAVSNLLDLTMVSKDLAEKAQLTVSDAENFVQALYVAIMFQGSPYTAGQSTLNDDFYAYTNRQFMATAQVTPGNIETSSFTVVSDHVNAQITSIISGITSNKNLTPGSDEWKINQIYSMYMDNDAREKSLAELNPIISDIDAATSIADLDAVSAKYVDIMNLQPFYGIAFGSDSKTDALKWAAYVLDAQQIVLPAAYYADDAQLEPIQSALRTFLAGVLAYAGETDNLDQRAAAVYDIFKSASQAEMPAAQQNDPSVRYTPVKLDDISPFITHGSTLLAGQQAYLANMNIYCGDIKYIQFVSSLYVEANLQALKDIALFQVFYTFGSCLGDSALDLQAGLQTALTGSSPRDTADVRAQQTVQGFMPDVMSNLYAAKYGTQTIKDDMTQMVETIRQKRIDLINGLDWMTSETKAKAIDKLSSVTAYVAYPDKPVSELNLVVKSQADGGSLVDVGMSYARAMNAKQTADLQNPVDQYMWDSVPTYTVNAYYDPTVNGIIIPLGILQAPFYDPNASEATNLGGIGAVIGHEFTHSVDNNGSQYDKNGTISDWWTDADYTAFAAKTKQLSDTLSNITFAGQNLNGPLIVGEAIADLGGLSAAISIAEDKNLDTGAVMTAWAKLWEDRMPAQVATLYLSIDVHPPAKLRVNFSLSQQDEFYRAFNIQPGDGMYAAPEDRINIW